MKKITELTDKEVLLLTHEDLDLMVKLRMAEEGIKILTSPKEPEYMPVPAPKEIAYSVEGFTHKFKDKDIADKLSSVITEISTSKMYSESFANGDYSKKIIKPLEEFYTNVGAVKKETYYTKDELDAIQDIIAHNNKIKKDFEYDRSDYLNEYEKGKEVREEVLGTYNQICDKWSEMYDMRTRFNEYLVLADYNVDIALNFLKKAYTVNEETEEYILAEAKV